VPCVVKVSHSSAGDGVRVCKTLSDIDSAKIAFKNIDGKIMVEQFIDAAHNIGVHLAVPFEREKPMQIIGVNEQITTDNGGYLGGIVDLSKTWPQMKDIQNLLLNSVLPIVREKGWYGVAGVDILIGKDGGIYVIDFNFRLTAPMPYLFQTKNGYITKPVITFTGTFDGDEETFKKTIVPLAKMGEKNQILDIVSLIKHENSYRFNCGMLFDDEASMTKNAKALLAAGVRAHVLERFAGR
jgi:phosphoribosylamine-glycine ligase